MQVTPVGAEVLNTALGATSLSTLIQMVLGKLGTTLVPEMALDQLISQHDELAAVYLNEPGPHRRIAFVVRPTYARISTIEALLAVRRESRPATDRFERFDRQVSVNQIC